MLFLVFQFFSSVPSIGVANNFLQPWIFTFFYREELFAAGKVVFGVVEFGIAACPVNLGVA